MLRDVFIKNKAYLFTAVCCVLAAVNIYDYKAHFGTFMSLVDYDIADQLLYNPAYAKEGYSADALVREIVRGRTVAVPRGLRPYSEYYSYSHMHDEGNPFSGEYFWENNYTKYFSEYAGNLLVDESLPDLYELQEKPLDEAQKADFILLGDGNDMMRYAFLGDHTDEEVSNQFYYTYFYTMVSWHPEGEALKIRICTEEIADDDRLVALWDTGENLYLMSRSYYEENIAGEYE